MKKCGILMVTLVMMFLVLLPQIALADEIVWEDNTKTGRETEGSDGSDFEGIDWGSETYEEKAEFTEEESKEEAVKEEGSGFDSTGAALGAAAALAAATLLLGRKGERNPEKAGVYIAAADRERILSSINSLTKKRYVIDSEGYLREDETAPPREEGSETYDSLLAGLINADKKTVIGTDSIYEAGGREEELEDGVAIGDNGTDQTVIVRGDAKDFGYTLAHELTHAYRGIYEHRKEDIDGGVNEDEEGNAILAENRIRYETGGELRRDGDSRADADGDGIGDGDGSYGKVTSEEPTLDWLYERFTGGEAASGTVFSFAKKTSRKSSSSRGRRGSGSKSSSSRGRSSKSSSSKSSSSKTSTSSKSSSSGNKNKNNGNNKNSNSSNKNKKNNNSNSNKNSNSSNKKNKTITVAETAHRGNNKTGRNSGGTNVTGRGHRNISKNTGGGSGSGGIFGKVVGVFVGFKDTLINQGEKSAKSKSDHKDGNSNNNKTSRNPKALDKGTKKTQKEAIDKVVKPVKTVVTGVVKKLNKDAEKAANNKSEHKGSKPTAETKGTSTIQTKTTGNPRKQVTPEVRKAADDAFDVHTVLDTVGFVPVVGEPADFVNGLIYAAEKDYINAGISIAAVIPLLGEAGKAVKYGAKAVDKGGEIAKAFNVVRKPLSKKESKTFRIVANGIEKVAKENADEAVEAVGKGSKTVGKGGKRTGGAYKDVPADGGQVHHMPADSVSPYSKGDGPGIRMATKDHMDTASWGRSKGAQAYRAKQKELIDKGLFREAQQMDIDDVRAKFGNKYNESIQEMLEYTDELLNK